MPMLLSECLHDAPAHGQRRRQGGGRAHPLDSHRGVSGLARGAKDPTRLANARSLRHGRRDSPTGCSLRSRSCSTIFSRSRRWGWRRSSRWYTIEGCARRCGAAKAAAFWTKIFAINFATGVVTGIPMEFQFGTNWAAFSARGGSVVGQPLAMEGVYAFFLESIFLGVLLYRARATSRRGCRRASAVCGVVRLVALGILHRRDRRVDAASGRLHDRRRPA